MTHSMQPNTTYYCHRKGCGYAGRGFGRMQTLGGDYWLECLRCESIAIKDYPPESPITLDTGKKS